MKRRFSIGFAAFGQVVEAMDGVKALFASPTKSEGVMNGQILEPAVVQGAEVVARRRSQAGVIAL